MKTNLTVGTKVEQAIERLWKTTPVGAGKDLNTVIRHIEQLQERLNKESF